MNDTDFSLYISKEYNGLKKSFISQCKKYGYEFDEDVFHDTIIHCFNKPEVDLTNIKNYLFCAFKQNLLRQKQYHCNSMHTDCEDYVITDTPYDCTESLVEYNDVMNLLENKFGKELVNIYKEYLNGFSIRELEETYQITGLNYKLKQIKQYALKVL